MGRDWDLFLHPERISPQLICPICTQILNNPVQTSNEHLFCEDELLEWMLSSNCCPVSKQMLVPEEIKKPGRVIINMLAELEVRCENHENGCIWTGQNCQYENHVNFCLFKSVDALRKELLASREEGRVLKKQLHELAGRNERLECQNKDLILRVDECTRKLRIYEALADSPGKSVASKVPSIDKKASADEKDLSGGNDVDEFAVEIEEQQSFRSTYK
jgi:hypothetical protein